MVQKGLKLAWSEINENVCIWLITQDDKRLNAAES